MLLVQPGAYTFCPASYLLGAYVHEASARTRRMLYPITFKSAIRFDSIGPCFFSGESPGAYVHELPHVLPGCGIPYMHVLPQGANEVGGARVVFRSGRYEEFLICRGFHVGLELAVYFRGRGGGGRRE